MPCDQVQTFRIDWGQKADRAVFARALEAAGWNVERDGERVRAYHVGRYLELDATGLRIAGAPEDQRIIPRLYSRQLVAEQARRAGFRVTWTTDAATGRETARLNRARGGF